LSFGLPIIQAAIRNIPWNFFDDKEVVLTMLWVICTAVVFAALMS
jgi:hypothetical protein